MSKKLILTVLCLLFFAKLNAQNNFSETLGVTLTIDEETKFPKITSVIDGSLAQDMHLGKSDLITRIFDEITCNKSIDYIIKSLHGRTGTNMSITVVRDGQEYNLVFVIDRLFQRYNNDQSLRNNWHVGEVDQINHIKCASQPNTWYTLPGYRFINPGNTGDKRTIWQPNRIHPDHNVVSGYQEGEWIPLLGYKKISNNNFDVTWTAGLRYPTLHITSMQNELSWQSDPGYVFTKPGKTTDVIWKPGLPHPIDPSLVSGDKEGSWVPKETILRTTAIVAGVILATFIESVIGPNMLSDVIYKACISKAVEVFIK